MDNRKGKEVVRYDEDDNEDYCDMENMVDNEIFTSDYSKGIESVRYDEYDNEVFCGMENMVDNEICTSGSDEDEDVEDVEDLFEYTALEDSNKLQESSTNITEQEEFANLTHEQIVAKQFDCLEHAEKFYRTYAKQLGFGVRNESLRKTANGLPSMRIIVRQKEGNRAAKWHNLPFQQRKAKLDFREGFPARIRVNRDRKTNKWMVSKFVMEHNHELMPQSHVHFVTSFRNIDGTSSKEIAAMCMGGVAPKNIVDVLARQSGGYDKLGFTIGDVYNRLRKEKGLEPPNGDITAVMSYFTTKKLSDSGYYFFHIKDDDNHLEHFFLADSNSCSDYACFSDVIAFDSTFKRNRYNKPLVFLIGINHHHQTIIFSSTVLANETTESYVWLLQEFIKCMGGKKPISVVTDGDRSMAATLREILPESSHRLFSYHLLQTAMSKIKKPGFHGDFRNLMFSRINETEFEEVWNNVVTKFDLVNDDWILKVYGERLMWVECFLKRTFFGGTRTTSRCEGMHSFLDQFVKRRLSFNEFLQRFETCLAKIRENEAEFDHKCRYGKIYCNHPLKEFEIPASDIYTCKSFQIFQGQLNEVVAYQDFTPPTWDESVVCFSVTRYSSHSKYRTVTYNRNTNEVGCSCNLFKSTGFPCRHQLFVLRKVGLMQIPTYLILPRWTKGEKRLSQSNAPTKRFSKNFLYDIRYGSLCTSFCRLSAEACKTVENYNKVRQHLSELTDEVYGCTDMVAPSSTDVMDPRLPGKKEMGSNPAIPSRRCSICKQTGHTKAKCPNFQPPPATPISYNFMDQLSQSSRPDTATGMFYSQSAQPDTATGNFYSSLPHFGHMNSRFTFSTQESMNHD